MLRILANCADTHRGAENIPNRHKKPTLQSIQCFVDVASGVEKNDKYGLNTKEDNCNRNKLVGDVFFKVRFGKLPYFSWIKVV